MARALTAIALILAVEPPLIAQRSPMASDSSPKAEVEQVMNPLLELTARLLEKHGEFYPVAGFLDANGRFELVATYDGNEHPAATQVLSDLRRVFQQSATPSGYRAIGLAYDVRVVPPGSTNKTDAVLVELEHHTGYRVNVHWPYTRGRSGPPTFGAPFAATGTLHCYDAAPPGSR